MNLSTLHINVRSCTPVMLILFEMLNKVSCCINIHLKRFYTVIARSL